jgi:hypothetical protein
LQLQRAQSSLCRLRRVAGLAPQSPCTSTCLEDLPRLPHDRRAANPSGLHSTSRTSAPPQTKSRDVSAGPRRWTKHRVWPGPPRKIPDQSGRVAVVTGPNGAEHVRRADQERGRRPPARAGSRRTRARRSGDRGRGRPRGLEPPLWFQGKARVACFTAIVRAVPQAPRDSRPGTRRLLGAQSRRRRRYPSVVWVATEGDHPGTGRAR